MKGYIVVSVRVSSVQNNLLTKTFLHLYKLDRDS